MKYDQFIELVQNRAQLASRGHAVSAIRATLEALSSRLTVESADNLAAQLPREIAYYIMNAPRAEFQRGERFDLDEFYRRVAKSESVDRPDAVRHAQVVMEVLGEAVLWGELDRLWAELPEEFDRLFEAGGLGTLRRRRRRYHYYYG